MINIALATTALILHKTQNRAILEKKISLTAILLEKHK